jgi:hypothetical protein
MMLQRTSADRIGRTLVENTLMDPTTESQIDFAEAIRSTKRTLRDRIGDPSKALRVVEDSLRPVVEDLVTARSRGEQVWPIIQFDDIAAANVPLDTVEAVRRRGCAVIKGTFERNQAEAWDAERASYIEDNDFFAHYRYIDDGIFGGLEQAKPSIFPIYWSKPQMEARQHPRMVVAHQFLNRFWKSESEGRIWFDPDLDTAYPDRIRRREPGSNSIGLSPHTDSGSVEHWLLPAYQQVFRNVFSDHPTTYDPWDGAYRTEVDEYPSTVMCSAFRTFQGWTALSDMAATEGVLHVIPIPSAMAYVLLRALQDDVTEDDLCGAASGQALPISERWHPLLMPALTPIPDIEPGDTVWWHGDLIHSVGSVVDQKGWGNVMYIPASPLCPKNLAYARSCAAAFMRGQSPTDFAPENYEVDWTGRATMDDLNEVGRRQLALG